MAEMLLNAIANAKCATMANCADYVAGFGMGFFLSRNSSKYGILCLKDARTCLTVKEVGKRYHKPPRMLLASFFGL